MSSTYDDCIKKMTILHNVVDNLFWGVFQLASIASCGVATTTAFSTGGLAIPWAIWACGSVVLNGVNKIAENITGGKSPFKVVNRSNGLVKDAVGCATGIVAGNWASCIQSTGKWFMKGLTEGFVEELKPENICNIKSPPTTGCTKPKNMELELWCMSIGTQYYFDFSELEAVGCYQKCQIGSNRPKPTPILTEECSSLGAEMDNFFGFLECTYSTK